MSRALGFISICLTIWSCANGGGTTWSSGMNDRDMFTQADLSLRDGASMDVVDASFDAASDASADDLSTVEDLGAELNFDLGADFGADMATSSMDAGVSCTASVDCSNGNPCDGEEECVSHHCVSGIALACDDSNVCTDDSCDPGVGCVNAAVPDDALRSCDDGRGCTIADRCTGGTCGGRARRCLSGCVCSEPSGLCVGEACELEPIE